MPSVAVIVPGRLATRTGGYEYDRRMVAGLRARGWRVDVHELDEGFPHPTAAALKHAAGVMASLPDGATMLVDGLAFGAMAAEVEREATRLRLVALVHLPLALAFGLAPDVSARFEAGERRALAAAASAVVTGRTTADVLASYGMSRDRIFVVEPGTDRGPIARGSGRTSRDRPLHLITVAALTPGKGHDILIHALSHVSVRPWRLTCAGSLDRDRATADRVRALIVRFGLEDRVSLAGELDAGALAACYDSADVFVLPTLGETYGMAVAEALSHGLPVVSTCTGAIADLVGDEAGLVVAPGDAQAVAGALSLMLADRGVRERFAAGARRVRDRLPSWDAAVSRMAAALS